MNIDTARKLDYYVGVPLCFFGAVIKNLFSPFARSHPGSPPRNVLFIELSEMGSAILADPAMLKLKNRLDVNLYFAIFRNNSPSLGLLDTIPSDNIFSMRDSGIFAVAFDAVRFFFWTRKNCIDTVIDLELFSRFTALLTAMTGAVRRVGFHAFYNEGLYRGNFLTHKVAYNPHQHIAKNFIALVNALLSDKVEIPYSKTFISDEEINLRKIEPGAQTRELMLRKVRTVFPDFDAELHKLVLFNTNASDLVPLRRWPEAYYVRLASIVLERYPRVVILLTGDPSERAVKEGIVKAVSHKRCVNFAGQTSIGELPTLYTMSAFMLTNDSGPAHFASVTTMPVYVLFGPETPKAYGPLGEATAIYSELACSPCVSAANHRKTVCRDNVCLQVITPDQVLQILSPGLDALQ